MTATDGPYIRGQRSIEHTFMPKSKSDYYIDPFRTIQDVIEPPIDETFETLGTQRLKRATSLLTLAELAIIEGGNQPSAITDYALAIARQNMRIASEQHHGDEAVLSDLSMLGLRSLFLTQDTDTRDSPEAYVYTSRVIRADRSIYEGAHFGPITNPYTDALHTFDSLDQGTLSFGEYIDQIAQELDVKPDTPQIAQVKSRALFEYASTLTDCEEKKTLLLDSILYASRAFTSNDGDHLTKGLTLRTLAYALHDVTYLPEPFGKSPGRNTKLSQEARNYAVSLLETAADELRTAVDEGADKSLTWPIMSEVLYFKGIYPEHAKALSDTNTETYENIGSYLTNRVIRRFGAQAIKQTLPFINAPQYEEAFEQVYEEPPAA